MMVRATIAVVLLADLKSGVILRVLCSCVMGSESLSLSPLRACL